MRKILIIIFALVIVLTLIATVYLYLTQKPATSTNETYTFPETETIPYTFTDGQTGPLLNPAKQALQRDSSSGNAVIDTTDRYTIEYFAPDETFNITLSDSHLRQARIDAQTTFLEKFQLTEVEACRLKVSVGTIESASPEYAGQELGLSFCPGFVDLPEDSAPASSASSSIVL